jgi:hypothetical protein
VFQKLTCALNEHCSGTKEPYDRREEGIHDSESSGARDFVDQPKEGQKVSKPLSRARGFLVRGFKKTAYPIELVSLT